ncbi:MAG: ATP-binding protein [Deltaproteobacteria bacterium]|nr:ATP-binding protein [Deltaproteobacteria bacterium]
MKLQFKIAFMIFGLGSLFLVSLTFLFHIYNRSQYINDLHHNIRELARERSVHVDIQLREKAAITTSIAGAPVIIDALEKSNATFTGMPNDGHGLPEEDSHADFEYYTSNGAADFLKELAARRPAVIKAIYLTNGHGLIVAASGKLPTRSFSGEYWWQSAYAEGKGRLFFDDMGVDKTDGGYVIGVALPVEKNNEIIGILKCNVNINSDLEETVDGARLGKTGQLSIVKSDGSAVFEREMLNSPGEALPQLAQAMKKREEGSVIIEGGKTPRMMAYVPISITFGAGEYGFVSHQGRRGEIWYALLSQDLDEALSPLYERLRGTLFIGLLTMVIMAFLSMFFGRKFASPVMRMEKLARRIGQGDFDVKLEVSSRDEIGLLAGSFNRMALNLRERTISRDLLAREVAERRETEEKLGNEERKYRELWQQFQAILHAITDSLVLLSPNREVIWSNKSGAGENALKCYNIWCSSSEPCKECPPLKSFESGMPEESRIATDDGKVWDVRSFPVADADNRVSKVIEVASDITEKVRLREEVMRAGQLASVGTLAAGVAHEINNPINGIINLAQLLVDENPPDDKDRDIYDWIISEGKRITLIVSELLSFARKNDEERKTIKIDDIITNSLTLTRAQMEKEGINIKMNIPSHLPEMVVNAGQLQQVLLNLISNARYALNRKYSGWDKNKILEISAEKIIMQKSPYLRIVLYDRGTGIPDNLMGKVVNPFFTTKPEEEGTGLGLSISDGIINDHGGNIFFDSREGEYTRVTVDLPIKETLEP